MGHALPSRSSDHAEPTTHAESGASPRFEICRVAAPSGTLLASTVDTSKVYDKTTSDARFLAAGGVPGKIVNVSAMKELAGGQTASVQVWCPSGGKAIGGGAHWGRDNATYWDGEETTGILNSSDQFGSNGWIAVGTNDEASYLTQKLTVNVECAMP